MRMLWHPADAEDATQEILVRIVTHLGSFRGESAFTTWVYRVASNYLLTTRKRRAEREELTFERFAEQLDEGLAPDVPGPAAEVENRLLVEEVKLGCSQGMLLCLDRDHRLAYILGDVFGVTESGSGRDRRHQPGGLSQAALPGAGTAAWLHGAQMRPGQSRQSLPLCAAGRPCRAGRAGRPRPFAVCQPPAAARA